MIVTLDLLWFRVMGRDQHKVERSLVVRNYKKFYSFSMVLQTNRHKIAMKIIFSL
jgi:hypothetical protein